MESHSGRQRVLFYPKADAAVLSFNYNGPRPVHPEEIGPIYDLPGSKAPIGPWDADLLEQFYPPLLEAFAPAAVPDKPVCMTDRYLRASLAKNERLRLSMLWYYTRDIFNQDDFLHGVQQKLAIAQDSTGWEFAITGLLDIDCYIRLATINTPLGILPRGETICAHMVAQPPGSVFLLPNMLDDWRFQESPYAELGGLRAYAGAPLRLQHESGDSVCLGSLCVASQEGREPLTKAQQTTITRLADWIVADMIHCARARRQRDRRRMADLLASAQEDTGAERSEDAVLHILKAAYPDAAVSLQSSDGGHIELEGRGPIAMADLEDGLWEDVDLLDDVIAQSNHLKLPTNRVVRVITAQCESISGPSLVVVSSKDFRFVFDDVDSWFVQSCAALISRGWNRRLLGEVMRAKEKFLRGFTHQLRTPIHGILGSVDLLAEDINAISLSQSPSVEELAPPRVMDADESANYLETIKRAGRDLISIVNSMITLNKWADIAVTNRDYAVHPLYVLETELANEVSNAMAGDTRYKPSIFFTQDMPPDSYSLRVDLTLFRDSLLPLIINAVQNTPEGIVVVNVSLRPDCKELIVDVMDNGCGIHPDNHQRIFELYEKVDPYATGAGLGLTLASKFAALLHGCIVLVSSNVGAGSHFRATFQEVELTCPSLLSQPLTSKFSYLPSKFHVLESTPHEGSISLTGCFAKFLTCCGFAPSRESDHCVIILDFILDMSQRRAQFLQIPPDQVAICLVPSSRKEPHLEEYTNVVYVRGPFLTPTMTSALQEADQVLSTVKADASRSGSDQPMEKPSLVPNIHFDFDADLARGSTIGTNEAISTTGTTSTRVSIGTSLYGYTNSTQGTSTDGRVNRINEQQHSMQEDDTQPKEPSNPPSVASPPAMTSADDSRNTVAVPQNKQPELNQPTTNIVPLNLEDNTKILLPPNYKVSTRPTALLVDDNAINLSIMQMYCIKRGLPYICAVNGLEAVEKFIEHQSSSSASIELILMDLQMPVSDGIEATKRIRQLEEQNKWKKSVLFIVTGQDSPTDRKAASDAGAEEFFVKPVGIKVLDRGVKQYFPAFQAELRKRA